MSRIALHLSSRRVFDQQILVPQWSASNAEPSGRHVPVGKTVGSEDKPVGSHALSGLLCQKQDTGLRARGVRQATPMSSRLKPLAEQKEKPPRGLHVWIQTQVAERTRKRGPRTPCHDAADGHRRARVSNVTEAACVAEDNPERRYPTMRALFFSKVTDTWTSEMPDKSAVCVTTLKVKPWDTPYRDKAMSRLLLPGDAPVRAAVPLQSRAA